VSQLELLNFQNHRHLRVRPDTDAAAHFVRIVAGEFAAAAASCPILLTKDAVTGHFYAGALFGFKPGESFLKESLDRGGFHPLNLQRDGFFISGEHIAIDRSNPRFSETDGEPLFDETQQPGVGLRHVQQVLGQLQAGMERTDAFIREMVDLKLIEPIDISLSFDNGERLTLQGLYTVSLDGLRRVDDGAALRLLRAGHLQLAYTMSASLQQMSLLAHLRNRRLAGFP
jgi:hypothetical protein